MSHHLAARERAEWDKVNVNLAASGIAYRERLAYCRNLSLRLPGGNDPVYHKESKD